MIPEFLNRILGTGKAPRTKRGWRCPDEITLAAFIDTQMGQQARARILNHLQDCRYCCDQVAAALRFQSGQIPSDVPPGLQAQARILAERKGSGRGMPVLRWGTLAAAAASIALVVGVTYRQPASLPTQSAVQPAPTSVSPAPPAPPPVAVDSPSIRSRQNGAAAPDLLFPLDGGVVSSTGIEFRWKRVTTALSYDVRVVTEDGDVVWESRTGDSRINLPSSIHLTAGELFYVRVGANLPEGKIVIAKVVGFKVKKSN